MTRTIPTACLLGLFVASATVQAAELPARKSGLWEITIEGSTGGMAMPGPASLQLCVEQGKDDITADPRATPESKQRCSKMDISRSAQTITIDSVCQVDKHTATSRTVVSGDMATRYRMETTTRFNPPMRDMESLSSTMSGTWLGACKPGQQHGAVTLTGVPGMGPGGELRIDPALIERIRQMQQQFGR